jgi:hypothetical protein
LSWALTVIHLTIEMSFSSNAQTLSGGILGGVNNESSTIENSKKRVIASRLIGSITAPSALFTNALLLLVYPKKCKKLRLSQHYNQTG